MNLQQYGIEDLRRLWREALDTKNAPVNAEKVLNRLQEKYQSLLIAFVSSHR